MSAAVCSCELIITYANMLYIFVFTVCMMYYMHMNKQRAFLLRHQLRYQIVQIHHTS
jgi:hypothetical protein